MSTSNLLKLLPAVILLHLAGCLGGCHVITENSGEWMLTFGSQIGVRTVAATTNSKSEVDVEVPAFTEWIFKPNEETQTTDMVEVTAEP